MNPLQRLKKIAQNYLPAPVSGILRRQLSEKRIALARKQGVEDFLPARKNSKPRILFFHPHGLGFGGTEKSLQIVAKHLNRELFDVYFMYSAKKGAARKPYLDNSGVTFMEFDYASIQNDFPFMIEGMRPRIFEAVKEKNIDLIVTAGAGYPEFPIANFSRLPIIYLNMFGSVDSQKNIAIHLCISKQLTSIVKSALPRANVQTMPIQSEGPDSGASVRGKQLRRRLLIPDSGIVFGRIGRPDNGIYDPIGIEAFRIASARNKNIHYIIVAPPPALSELLKNKPVERVHLLQSTGNEDEIWAFHNAIDVLAHFRKDGETMGLNIAESMLCRRPVISHVSSYWNAHLEFLEPGFSFVAGLNDVIQYADFMEIFAKDASKEKIHAMGEKAFLKADSLFQIRHHIKDFERFINLSLEGGGFK